MVSNSAGIGTKGAAISFTPQVVIRRLGVVALSRVRLPQLCHEVAVEHGLPHLSVLLGLRQLVGVLASGVETAHSRLIEDLLLVELVDVRQHLVDPRVIRRLEHDASLSCVHFIDGQGPVARGIASLLPHPVGHEEGLIWFLCSEPTKYFLISERVLTFRSSSELATSSERPCNFDCSDV